MSTPPLSSPRGNPNNLNRMPNSGWREQGEQGDEDEEDLLSGAERDKINFLSLKEQGCTMEAEMYDTLCLIRNALLQDRAELRVAMVEDGLKEFEKIWAKVAFPDKRILINNKNTSWDNLVDRMNEFIVAHKARTINKVKIKAPVVKISPWDGKAASFFAWFGQTIKLLEKLEWDPIVEKSVLMESLPDIIKGRCDQFISADEIKSFIWRSYGTDAFLTKGMEEILKKTSRFEGMEEFISNTIPNILKIDSALGSYSALGRFGREDVNMRVWNTAILQWCSTF